MGAFSNKKVINELDSANIWFTNQALKYRIDLENLGVPIRFSHLSLSL